MKLWEIKAQSLRIMFSDSDVQFSYAEFEDQTIYANPNTGNKLVRMNDSIKRAIDLFYSYNRQNMSFVELYLYSVTNPDTSVTYSNYVDCSSISIDEPTNVDAKIYQTVDGVTTQIGSASYLDFFYDHVTKRIYFINDEFTSYEGNIKFTIYYRVKYENMTDDVNELTFDLTTLSVPENVQRMIPYFVKGELYEEDEPQMAQLAMNTYLRYIANLTPKTTFVQTKVKRANVFNK